MTLQQLARGGASFAVRDLWQDQSLTVEIQERLSALGFLDPPADGKFGPVSLLAMQLFAAKAQMPNAEVIDAACANALLNNTADTLFPITRGTDLASRVVQFMLGKGYWVARAPGYLSIVYVEGMNEDGAFNDDVPNHFNDCRMVLAVEEGKPKILGRWEGTTEPGAHYTFTPENPKGAARIALGQYKAWRVGTHFGGGSDPHEALVQVENIKVHRDFDKNFKREDDALDVGVFHINQHWGFDNPVNNIGKASAGCLVGRTRAGHRQFMQLIKSDPRYAASNGYVFMTTVIAGEELRASMS